ncbi:unnamed protein product, partial [Symbiodinium sp. CCMP2456]
MFEIAQMGDTVAASDAMEGRGTGGGHGTTARFGTAAAPKKKVSDAPGSKARAARRPQIRERSAGRGLRYEKERFDGGQGRDLRLKSPSRSRRRNRSGRGCSTAAAVPALSQQAQPRRSQVASPPSLPCQAFAAA